MASGHFSKVYHSAQDDPAFAKVWNDNDALATWLRMLVTADAMYPLAPPLPRRNSAVRLLLAAGLVIERPGKRFTILGLEAERDRRSSAARTAAAMRWHSESSAGAMQGRDREREEKRREDLLDRGGGSAVASGASPQRPPATLATKPRQLPPPPPPDDPSDEKLVARLRKVVVESRDPLVAQAARARLGKMGLGEQTGPGIWERSQ